MRGSTSVTSVSRRDVLRAGAVLGAGGLLAACSSGPQSSGGGSSSAAPTGTSGATGGSSSGGPFALDDATKAKLGAIFDQQMKNSGIAGMAAAVWMGDAAWTRSAGYGNLEQKTPYPASAIVRIASITKSFTASAVLLLVDAGALKLDDAIERFVPGLPNGTTITIKNLLGMSSGLFDFTADDGFTKKFDADPTMPWSFADTLAIVKAHPPVFAPGTQLQYCDANYAILGEVLTKVTGQPAGAVITDSVVKKLGLRNTSYPTGNSIPDPHPNGYVPVDFTPAMVNDPFDNTTKPPRIVNEVNPAVPSTAGAMASTLEDLKAWGKEIAVGSLLKPATQALRLQYERFPNVPVNLGYGLGCERINDFSGHNGAIYGFSSVVFHNPKTDVTIAAVGNESTNFTTPTATFAYLVLKSLIPDQWK